MRLSHQKIPLGAGLVSLSLLLWEIFLSRLYSVLLFYYFAFAVISLAMLGFAIGAVWVTLSEIPEDRIHRRLSRDAAWTSVGILFGIVVMTIASKFLPAVAPPVRIVFLFAISSLPCISAGKFICLILTRGGKIGPLYAADMLGAGIACLISGILLSLLGGPGAVCIAALPAAFAAVLLSEKLSLSRIAGALAPGLITAALLTANPGGMFQFHSGAGYGDIRPIHEKWNAFSRVAVLKLPMTFNWGISDLIEKSFSPPEQLQLEVDCGSMTPLTKFDGRLESLAYLKHDITAFAHYLKPNSNVLVIGPGGGRDVLASLAFEQEQIDAVEINPAIIDAVNDRFGDFTGHLDKRPNVRFHAAEGRNFVERSGRRFGIIVISLVDTWSASAAGAFAFVENGLYTVESWKTLISHLEPDGILSLTRWYYGSTSWPVHIARACVLGMATMRQMGFENPERHIVVLRLPRVDSHRSYVGTVLISPTPFSEMDLMVLARQCRASGCEIAYSWKYSADSLLSLLMTSKTQRDFIDSSPMDISPVTDDRPYFQFYDRLFAPHDPARHKTQNLSPGGELLKGLLFGFALISLVLISIPAIVGYKKGIAFPVDAHRLGLYFTVIGVGYMFVELALIQRFSLFLGHPSFGFSVILFALLGSSAAGSFYSEKMAPHVGWYAGLAAALFLLPFLGGKVLSHFTAMPTLARVVIALVVVAPLGFTMGLFLPWGLRSVGDENRFFAGWCWIANSAMSVFGAVAGTTSLISFGETRTAWAAAVFYLVSCILLRTRLPGRPRQTRSVAANR